MWNDEGNNGGGWCRYENRMTNVNSIGKTIVLFVVELKNIKEFVDTAQPLIILSFFFLFRFCFSLILNLWKLFAEFRRVPHRRRLLRLRKGLSCLNKLRIEWIIYTNKVEGIVQYDSISNWWRNGKSLCAKVEKKNFQSAQLQNCCNFVPLTLRSVNRNMRICELEGFHVKERLKGCILFDSFSITIIFIHTRSTDAKILQE